MTMIVFEVPFAQRADGIWAVSVNDGETSHFGSRVAGLSFAMEQVRRLSARDVAAIVSVEGADGRWRAFDAGIKHFTG